MARNKYYFKVRTDGLSGVGTISNPFNGSIAEYFDQGMRSIPPNSDIYWGAGNFYTSGYTEGVLAWRYQNGWRVKGAGIDKTILRPVNISTGVGTVRKLVIAADYNMFAHNSRWENFTIDCDIENQIHTSGYGIGGIGILGQNVLIRKVKVVGAGSRRQTIEAFAITNGGGDLDSHIPFSGAIIDSCIVEKPITTNIMDGITAISCGGYIWSPPYDWHDGATIRNCHVNLSGYTTTGNPASYSQAYSCYGKNALTENNTCDYCNIGFYEDTTDVMNVTVRNNYFKNVQYGFDYNLYDTAGFLRTGYYLNNHISFADEMTRIGDLFNGFRFLGKNGPTSRDIEYIVVSGNTVDCANGLRKVGSDSQNAYFCTAFHGITGLIIDNFFNVYNTGDPYLANKISISTFTGYSIVNNKIQTNAPIS